MYLKTLELQGFKSFPDKTVLTFDSSVTAVVGPNGSGKSNISDAIRWVLGEQSVKTLRGGKMEDVIFGGTPQRKRQGFAEVSLTLDNTTGVFASQESELMVTRRYYRSGESEYYLNRCPVRLKDINELFMDTGLGQEGYSLIGQGRIDEILSAKSTQRREIFEEAAGISRYRHRKEESQRKLERTQENLLRIGDKLEELELQVEPLREQAEKAMRFQALGEELRVLEISLWMHQLDGIKDRAAKAQDDCETAARQLAECQDKTDALYAMAEALGERVREQETAAEDLRRQIAGGENELSAGEHTIALFQERMQNNENNAKRLQAELSMRKEREGGIGEQIAQKKARLEALEEKIAACQGQLEDSCRQLEALEQRRAMLSDGVSQQEAQAEAKTREAGQLERTLAGLEASGLEIKDRREKLLADLAGLQEGQAALARVQAQDEAEEQAALEEQKKLEQSIREGNAQVAACRSREKEAEETWMRLRMEESAITSRTHILAEMEKGYEGYSKGVKSVMNEVKRGQLKGVCGPVAGLLRVPPAYTVAIETALGGALQHLVVDSEEAGKAVLRLARQRDAGRVTCLPMTAIRPVSLRETGLETAEGYLGIAAALVECAPQYRDILFYLLGRVVVVRNLDDAVSMARQWGHRFQIVTLDGEKLNAGGSMTGGSVNRRGGILSRAAELKAMIEKQEKAQKQKEAGGQGLENARKETAKASRALEELQQQRREREDRLLTLKNRRESRRAQQENGTIRIQNSQSALAQLEERAQENEAKEAEIRAALEEGKAAAAALQQEKSQGLQGLEALDAKAQTLTQGVRRLREEQAAMEGERQTSQQILTELNALRDTFQADRAKQEETLAGFAEDNAAIGREIRAREEALCRLRQQLTDHKARLRRCMEEKLQLDGRREQTDRDSRSQNDQQLRLQREVSALEQKKLQISMEESQLLDKLWDTYQMTHQGAREVCIPLEGVPAANRRVGELNQAIRALGSVNPGAIAEFQRVNERYRYLRDQKADVETAQAKLEQIIHDLTNEMREIFRREFQRIAEAFATTFVELFGGGRAALELEDEEDILNCGIEIRVQPPGKTLRVISLLSGGERAFVAIALYFAILKVRPTPFCVMDEIEAALDEANVARFVRYLRTMADKTQFILITHRRGTMEASDVLYGITMEHQGISRVLKLDLNEAEQSLRQKA